MNPLRLTPSERYPGGQMVTAWETRGEMLVPALEYRDQRMIELDAILGRRDIERGLESVRRPRKVLPPRTVKARPGHRIIYDLCTEPGCPLYGCHRGMCSKHYMRWYRAQPKVADCA